MITLDWLLVFSTYKDLHHDVKTILLQLLNRGAVKDWEACDVEPKFSADIYTTFKIRSLDGLFENRIYKYCLPKKSYVGHIYH
jgi:hypothetical protein